MSGGYSCKCPERKKPLEERAWECLQFKCNRSVFNGGRLTRSDYSAIRCAACGAVWRTKCNWAGMFTPSAIQHRKERETPAPETQE